jgi:hypothetical protein
VLAYLALSRPGLRELYGYETIKPGVFFAHMEEFYRFVTPKSLGASPLAHVRGRVEAFARDRGVNATQHVFDAPASWPPAAQDAASFRRLSGRALRPTACWVF